MIFIWLLFGFLAISIFSDAVRLYKHEDNLVMIFFIVVSGFLLIYSNFIFLEEHVVEAIIFEVYIMIKAGRSDLKPKPYLVKKPSLYLSLYLITYIIALSLYLIFA